MYCKTYRDKNRERNRDHTEDYIHFLQDKGFFITKKAEKRDYRFKPDITPYKGNKYRIGFIADTQIGSRYQQLTHLHTFYKICQEQGICDIFHCGDIVDGQHMYNGQEYELFLHGCDAQTEYCINQYPEYKDITTYFICGNHDESHYKLAQYDIGKHLSNQRKDMRNLGFYGAFIDFADTKNLIYLHHGTGGVAYARSYKIQKIIEQLAPDQKPFMLFEGHYHVSCHIPEYRNVFAWQMPCFQSQTPYLKAKGLYPEIAGLIIEFMLNEGKPVEYHSMVIPFHIPKTEDF